MTDTDTLRVQIEDAIMRVRDAHPRRHDDAPSEDVADAVLAVVQPAIREAQAEALRDAARDIEASALHLPGTTVTHAYRSLRFRADDIERSTDA